MTYIIEEDQIRRDGIYGSIQAYLNNNCSNYFVKDNDWKDEYRFLCWNKLENRSKQKIEIGINDALIGIIVGINNNDIDLVKIAKTNGVNNILKLKYDGLLYLEAL